MPRSLRLSLVFLATACGSSKSPNNDGITGGNQSPNNVTLVAPSHPRGTVSGQVLTVENAPLKGATVTLNLGEPSSDVGQTSWQTTTDGLGNFAIIGVPAGATVLVEITAVNYATVHESTVIPANAGTFPIDDGNAVIGPIQLTALTGKLALLVVDHTGAPVNMGKLTVEAVPAGSDLSSGGSFGIALGSVVVQTTTDANGNAVVANLPDPQDLSILGGEYTVTVPAIVDSNGNPVSAGTIVTYTGSSVLLDPSVRVIQLPQARANAPLAVVASNVGSLVGTADPLGNLIGAGPLYVVFNQAIQAPSFVAVLADEYGLTNIPVSPTYGENNAMVTLQVQGTLNAGQEYNLSLRADSLDNGTVLYTKAYMFGGTANAPTNFGLATGGNYPGGGTSPIEWVDKAGLTAGLLDPTEDVFVYFNEPLGVVGTPSALYITFDYDLDNSGTIGDAPGETGYTGTPISTMFLGNDEPVAESGTLFPLQPSGYTTRWVTTYNPPPNKTLGAQTVPASTPITLWFSKVSNSVGGYQTVWGQPALSDIKQEPLSRAQ